MANSDRPQVNFRIDPELRDSIKSYCDTHNISITEFWLSAAQAKLEEKLDKLDTQLDKEGSHLDEILDERIESAIASRFDSFHQRMETLEKKMERLSSTPQHTQASPAGESYPTENQPDSSTTGKTTAADNDFVRNQQQESPAITPAAPKSLTQADLARRLKTSSPTLNRRRSRSDFAQWSRTLDPDGVGWEYRRKQWRYYPL